MWVRASTTDSEAKAEEEKATVYQIGKTCVMGFKKPRPRPAKKPRASDVLTQTELHALAAQAQYVGSQHHTDIPKYGLLNRPRRGWSTIEDAEKSGIDNPSCTVCPRKWASRRADANRLLLQAIENGDFVVSENASSMPLRVWARDPEDPQLVYEAKLSYPQGGYKAYPLTQHQAEALPIELL
jgi:hypothetical protein